PEMLNALHLARSNALEAQTMQGHIDLGLEKAINIGSGFQLWSETASNDYVGHPGQSMPTGHGTIHPVGVGDLLMVREHVLRYEGGDLAHVENVLKSETLSRETRRLERTETTILQESETTKEQTR